MRYDRLLPVIGLILSTAGQVGAQEQGATPADPQKTQEELGQLRDYVMDAEGAVQTAISDVNKIKRISFSGYIQARFEDHQQGFIPGKVKNGFSVRRARLKASAKPTSNTAAVLQADFGGLSPSLKDAYVEWFPFAAEADASYVLTAGQLKWPFGYQVVQSSSVRETPERAQFAKRFFDGERDRGAMISTPLTWPVRARAGIFNGVGANKADDNNRKDFVGRVCTSLLGSLDLGASVYLGQQLVQAPVAAVPAVTATVPSTGEVITITPGKAAVPAVQGVRNRYGVDLQWVPLTGLNINAEYVAGRDGLADGRVNRAHGWYVLGAYSLFRNTRVVGMFDRFREGAAGNARSNSKDIWTVGVNQWVTNATRVRLFYNFVNDHPTVTGASRRDNFLQAEMITLF